MTMAFDTTKFARDSRRLAWQDLDFASFRTDPLPPETLRCLRYMCDIEFHTVCYMRDMLMTPSQVDGEISTFMTMWNREEYWHGEALAAVLGEHGITVDYDELKATRLRAGWKDKLAPVRQALAGMLVGADFIAVHMSWGAANEWSATAAYQRLAAMESHPALSPLLRRIAKQETRHVAFYASQARRRLERSRKAQLLTRYALRKFWGPVGSGVMPDAEVTHVMGHLFAGAAGADQIDRIDGHIGNLPGMKGLTILRDAFLSRRIPLGAH
ncbi:hypothetical protein Asera_63780 [Actinocatenispora sera]|uniref:Ferritin-like domain-containing protein n=2 Tax=Actinocatenispora sera TaxID=390989 RepID=A0A810L9N2_9ACTN|nr:hypothetical protein Asera_63780 [Actinocatenispora sera]